MSIGILCKSSTSKAVMLATATNEEGNDKFGHRDHSFRSRILVPQQEAAGKSGFMSASVASSSLLAG